PIHPETVCVVPIQPEESAADEERLHLIPAIIEDQALPFGVKSPLGRGMLVQVGPVIESQSVRVRGKMGGDPVQDDADTVSVEVIDQVHEIARGAVPAGGGKIPDGLVSPGSVEGML